MKQTITRQEVEDRWVALRRRINNSVYPEDVANFLSKSESELTKQKIKASLIELANYRLDSPDGWVNEGETSAQGDIVICEGLETFFVPAVEGAFGIQEFLDAYPDRSNEFLKAVQDDLSNLLERWTKKGFEGAPYIKGRPNRALKPEFHEKGINLVESASMAIRVIVHFYNLVLRQSEQESRFSEFFEPFLRSHKAKLQQIFSKALEVTVEAFQKGEDGKIGTAETEGMSGSGWSWCQFPGLPPMLYFTQNAVDAFTELDIYLIRPWISEEVLPVALEKLYSENEEFLKDYQFCVEMAGRWVTNKVLNQISHNYGFYYEESAQVEILDTIDDDLKIDQYLTELEAIDNFERDKNSSKTLSPFVIRRGNKEKELNAPFVEYNSLYALTILLWSFGDQREDGEEIDTAKKAKIERALLQMVINYRQYPVIKKILDGYPFRFKLPDIQEGDRVFSSSVAEDHQLAYEDSGFLTLLARLLVQFGVYGMADHSLLDPIIRDLYVELLFARNRRNAAYPNLWSQNDVEVFSTFRAVQTLSFYCIYQQGRERSQKNNAPSYSPAQLFRTVADQLSLLDTTPSGKSNGNTEPNQTPKVEFPFNSFREFYLKNSKQDWPPTIDDKQKEHVNRFASFGDRIIHALVSGQIEQEKGEQALAKLTKYVEKPWDKNGKLLHASRIEALEEFLGIEEK